MKYAGCLFSIEDSRFKIHDSRIKKSIGGKSGFRFTRFPMLNLEPIEILRRCVFVARRFPAADVARGEAGRFRPLQGLIHNNESQLHMRLHCE